MIWGGYDPDTDTVHEISPWTWVAVAVALVLGVSLIPLLTVLAFR